MKDFMNKFKIPTLLGLSIIFFGIAGGVFLVGREQTFFSQAAPDLTPQNITFTNITDNSVVISWQTSQATNSFVTFGQENPQGQTVLDDRDLQTPTPRKNHYVTLKNLLPETRYQLKIVSGKITSEVIKFTTVNPPLTQNGFRPVIGSVLEGNTPLNDGIAYLSIAGAVAQSSLIKTSGNFLIPISKIRKSDLSDTYSLTEDSIAKLTIISDKGDVSVLFKLKVADNTLPILKLGQDIDLTTPDVSLEPVVPSVQELQRYDLNSDGKINAADNAIILQNFGRNPKNIRADLNGDSRVDQKDLEKMAKQINQ